MFVFFLSHFQPLDLDLLIRFDIDLTPFFNIFVFE